MLLDLYLVQRHENTEAALENILLQWMEHTANVS